MVGWLLRPGRAVVKVLTDADSPKQIALGCALGMLIGLVPKGNLIALTLGILLFTLRADLGAGALAAFSRRLHPPANLGKRAVHPFKLFNTNGQLAIDPKSSVYVAP